MTFVIEWRYCEIYTPWPWPTFFISNVSNMWNSFVFVCCRRPKYYEKICNTYIYTFIHLRSIERQKSSFLLCNLDLHFLFHMLKICEIRSFSYVFCRKLKLWKNQQYTFQHLRSNGASSPVFLLHDLDLHFRFQMFKICEIRSFSYVAGS